MSNHPIIRGNSSDLRKGRISEAFECYGITKVVLHRKQVLATSETSQVLLDSWQFLRQEEHIKLFAFCIMPDHYHLLFCLLPGQTISQLMERSNRFTSRLLNKLLDQSGTFWLEGFHDHRCRDTEEVHDLGVYYEHNPVRANLVMSADQWPYSSAHPSNRHLLDRDWWPSR